MTKGTSLYWSAWVILSLLFLL